VSLLVATSDCHRLHTISTGHDTTVKAQFSPDGTTVALSGYVRHSGAPSDAASVVLVDVETGGLRPLRTPKGQLVVGLAFHPTGRFIATGESSGAIRVFDTGTLEERTVLEGGTTQATFLTYDPGGDVLFSAFDDGVIRMWDVATGRALTTLTGHSAGVYWLEIRPDGRQLASAALDTSPRLWSIPRYSGTAEGLGELIRCRVPWKLVGGMPVPAAPPTGCAR